MWLAQAHTRQTSSIICNLLYVSITVHFVSTFYVMSKNSLYSNYCYSSWAQRQPEEKLSICQPAMSNIQFYTVAVYRSSDTRTEILKSTHYFGVCRRKCKWTFFCTFHCGMHSWTCRSGIGLFSHSQTHLWSVIHHVSDLGRVSPTSIKSRFSWTRFNVDHRFEPSSRHDV